MRILLSCLFFFLCWLPFREACSAVAPVAPASAGKAGWTVMQAGARPAYMGIHGGTMPVSLLVVADGSSLLGFVGRTGNDFLDVLHKASVPFFSSPSFKKNGHGESVKNSGETNFIADILSKTSSPNVNGLFVTGAGLTSLPVIQVNSGLGALPLTLEQLLPFGFSDKPLPIEGEISLPSRPAPERQYRLVFDPRYLQPRNSR